MHPSDIKDSYARFLHGDGGPGAALRGYSRFTVGEQFCLLAINVRRVRRGGTGPRSGEKEEGMMRRVLLSLPAHLSTLMSERGERPAQSPGVRRELRVNVVVAGMLDIDLSVLLMPERPIWQGVDLLACITRFTVGRC